MTLELVDTHCHLDMLEDSSVPQALKDAQERGVSCMLNPGISQETFKKIKDLSLKVDNLFFAVGIHPNYATQYANSGGIEAMQDYINTSKQEQNSKLIALGETGLDYYRQDKNAPNFEQERSNQMESFSKHIELSIENNLPLIVHSRDAERDTIDLIKYVGKGKATGIMHCFTGSLEMALSALELGFYISFSGIITFNNAKPLREIAKQIPLEKTLIETDAPYLAPQAYRGKPNQPAYVYYAAQALAEIHDVTIEQVGQTTSHNFFQLFPNAREVLSRK